VSNKTFSILHDSADQQRLDVFLSEKFRFISRSQIQKLLEEGRINVEDQVKKASYRLKKGETVTIHFVPAEPENVQPEAMQVDFVYQDDQIVVVDKSSGQVVHPGAGREKSTLVSALLFQIPELKGVGPIERAGIVHRLDKETSGLMVVAKTIPAFRDLQRQFRIRSVEKVYLGLVWGKISQDEGRIAWPIGRHVKHGARMSVKTKKPREAVTHYQVLKRLEEYTFLEIKPLTGRTHQIRVHMAASGFPLVGDRRYGRRETTKNIPRLFLHAHRLAFVHPGTGKRVEFCSLLPPDLAVFLESLTE
jgi:23S rRNA pseudouridine1911/1915/1917 synthase